MEKAIVAKEEQLTAREACSRIFIYIPYICNTSRLSDQTILPPTVTKCLMKKNFLYLHIHVALRPGTNK